MAYPGQSDLLNAQPLLPWLDEHFLRPDPFGFLTADFRSFALEVSAELDVDANGVFCLGSGAVGLSLNPDKITSGALKSFGLDSDFDIAIISETLFETAWRDLRVATQPTASEVDPDLRSKLGWQKKRFFDGAILAKHLLPWLSFGPEWSSALVRISQSVAIALDREIDVNIWIYRDYWSVRNYVAESVIKCKRSLTSE